MAKNAPPSACGYAVGKTCAALRQTSRQQTHPASLGRTAIFGVYASKACFVGNPSFEGVCRACQGCLCARRKDGPQRANC
jgi:hypothetical protein